KAEKPDVYPVAGGTYKVNDGDRVARTLRSLPSPVSPADAGQTLPGAVTLRIRNIPDKGRKDAEYVFEISSATGEQESSPAVAAGKKETSWTPRMKVATGRKYTWTARAVQENWRGPVALMTFRVKAKQ